MSILAKLFGRPRRPKLTPDEAAAALARAAEPVLAGERTCLAIEAGPTPGRSWLGGAPTLNPATPWPPHRADSLLDFLAQIDLAEVRAAGGPDWLPAEGRLLFFYDIDDPGDAPSYWRVIHETGPAGPPRTPPAAGRPARVLPKRDIRFVPTASFDLRGVYESLGEEAYEALQERFGGHDRRPSHKLGGYADAIQDEEMELECAQATGDPSADHARAVAEWRLLLQIDSDPALDLQWGDSGMVYFWIPEADARRGDFSRARAIWQCY